MKYTTLGDTGMTVSRLCLGCMSFGLDSSQKYNWSLGEDESTEIIERAIDLGITFFDTANTYSWGDSERVLGKTIDGYDTDSFVIASKVFNAPMETPHPNATGLSRKTIDQELEHTLDRLNIDTLDLYQTHRWDYDTPIEETLRALTATVQDGRTRYIGASSMWTYQFADALHTADTHDLESFATMQNHYNLVYREEEREMLPYCDQQNIGVIPWSPLARGYLTRPHDEFATTSRGKMEDEERADRHSVYRRGGGKTINNRVEQLANDKDATMAQIALAWQLHKDWVDAPIIGTTSIAHLEEAVEAIDISLSTSDIEYLEEPYEPVPISGHQ